MREHSDEDTHKEIEEALTPPRDYRVRGVPAWYGSDDDAWSEFARQSK